jgi:hypothetical protein
VELSEKEKMLSGLLYNPMDKTLLQERIVARTLLKELNDLRPNERTKHSLKQQQSYLYNHHFIAIMVTTYTPMKMCFSTLIVWCWM